MYAEDSPFPPTYGCHYRDESFLHTAGYDSADGATTRNPTDLSTPPSTSCSTAGVFSIMRPSASAWCAPREVLVFPCHESDSVTLVVYDFVHKLSVTFVTFFLFVVVASLGAGKIYVDGFADYSRYFTNWAWTLYGIYYLLVFLGHTFCGSLTRVALLVLTPVVNGVCWSVLAIVFVIVYNNPDLLLGMMAGMGGSAPAGLVLVMNCIFHPVAVVLFLVFLVMHRDEVASVYFDARFWMAETDLWCTVIWGLLLVYSPAIMLGIYLAFNDPTQVYGYPVINEYTIVSVLFICTFLNGIPCVLAINRMPPRPNPCDHCNGFHSTSDMLHGMSVIFAYSNAVRPAKSVRTIEDGTNTAVQFTTLPGITKNPESSQCVQNISLTRRTKERVAWSSSQ